MHDVSGAYSAGFFSQVVCMMAPLYDPTCASLSKHSSMSPWSKLNAKQSAMKKEGVPLRRAVLARLTAVSGVIAMMRCKT